MGQVSTRSYTAREDGNTNLKSGRTNWGRSKFPSSRQEKNYVK
jgi:hypothetical protein